MSAGKIVSETKNEKLGTTDLSLSNGVTITVKPTTFKNDEILMDSWRWGAGSAFHWKIRTMPNTPPNW